jgi:hypothetical protein
VGVIRIITDGSFPKRVKEFSAMEHGHAAAISDAIAWLSDKPLKAAIRQDHELHEDGEKPSKQFGYGDK